MDLASKLTPSVLGRAGRANASSGHFTSRMWCRASRSPVRQIR
jgi:hypothetical protein